MDQSATTQAYVSGMQEALSLYGNELVEFTTYFSIGYALAIVPSQMIQTLIRPSLFLPACEVIWGLLTLTYELSSHETTPSYDFSGHMQQRMRRQSMHLDSFLVSLSR